MGRCFGCCQENCNDCNCSCHAEEREELARDAAIYAAKPLHAKHSAKELREQALLAEQRELENDVIQQEIEVVKELIERYRQDLAAVTNKLRDLKQRLK